MFAIIIVRPSSRVPSFQPSLLNYFGDPAKYHHVDTCRQDSSLQNAFCPPLQEKKMSSTCAFTLTSNTTQPQCAHIFFYLFARSIPFLLRIRVLPSLNTTVALLPLLALSSYPSSQALLLLHQSPIRRMRSFDLLQIPKPPSSVRCFSFIEAISGPTSLDVLVSLLHVQPL